MEMTIDSHGPKKVIESTSMFSHLNNAKLVQSKEGALQFQQNGEQNQTNFKRMEMTIDSHDPKKVIESTSMFSYLNNAKLVQSKEGSLQLSTKGCTKQNQWLKCSNVGSVETKGCFNSQSTGTKSGVFSLTTVL